MTREEILSAVEAADRAVLVMIERAEGSTPREVGASLLVSEAGVAGTIGGGAMEHEAIAIARRMLAAGPERRPGPDAPADWAGAAADIRSPAWVAATPTFAPLRLAFPLGPTLDQCCGGSAVLAFAPLTAADLTAAVTTPDEIEARRRRLGRRGEAFRLWPGGPLFRPDPPPRPVLVYGGGHVGSALVTALAPLPFAVRWIDARKDGFLVAAPAGVVAVTTPLPEAEAAAAPHHAFHVVLTHSHALDLEIVAAVLERGAFGFLGLIGSVTKKALFVRRLGERGVSGAAIARLVCPIGLDAIRDKRPAVIAASVAAQLLEQDLASDAREVAPDVVVATADA